MKLTRSLALYYQPFPPLGKLMHSLVRELADIGSQMPGGTDLASKDLTSKIGTPWLVRYVMMHLSWHQSYTELVSTSDATAS
jgi:hypothetical protein